MKNVNDIKKLQNVFIGGSSGSGKTNVMQNLLYDYLAVGLNNGVEFYILDTKGVDFVDYFQLPQLKDKIACNITGGKLIVEKLYKELCLRKQAFKMVGAKCFSEYKELAICDDNFSEIVVFIDEIADLSYDKKTYKLLKALISLGKNYGMFFAVATQVPKLFKGIKKRFNYIIACKTITEKDSQILIKTKDAINLPQGKVYVLHNGKLSILDVEYYSQEEQLKDIQELLKK